LVSVLAKAPIDGLVMEHTLGTLHNVMLRGEKNERVHGVI
jgi:hypothetical protein